MSIESCIELLNHYIVFSICILNTYYICIQYTYIPETNIALCANYISIKKLGNKQTKKEKNSNKKEGGIKKGNTITQML